MLVTASLRQNYLSDHRKWLAVLVENRLSHQSTSSKPSSLALTVMLEVIHETFNEFVPL